MTTQAGVGYSERSDSFSAGQEAAGAALREMGGGSCDLALLFSTSAHEPRALARGVRAAIGEGPRLLGGYAVGVVTNDALGYDGFQVGVALLRSDSAEFHPFHALGLPAGEQAVGAALGRQVAALDPPAENLLLLYDSVDRSEGRFNLNMAVPLLEGLSGVLEPGLMRNLVGAGLVGDMACKETFQWFDDAVHQGSAMALATRGGLSLHTTVLHGCRPLGDYFTITATDGPAVLEIEGRPALDFISDLLGKDKESSWRDYAFFVTLGVNQGEKYGEFREENYQNRLCLRADIKRNALVMFEPDLKPGSEVQLMRRSIDLSYVEERVEGLLETIPAGKRPVLALYIDCAGRAARYCGADEEEAAEVVRVLNRRVPFLGLYSGVEVGQLAGRPQSLDWTGVLAIYCE